MLGSHNIELQCISSAMMRRMAGGTWKFTSMAMHESRDGELTKFLARSSPQYGNT